MKFARHTIKSVAIYSLLMALLIFALKWMQWKFLIADHSMEIYVGLLAILFTGLGVWMARQVLNDRKQLVIVDREVPPRISQGINEELLEQLQLSKREQEVLQLLVQGYSNSEIADTLCLSVSTIKTHVSNLFVKLDVRSRTQALEKAKRLSLVP